MVFKNAPEQKHITAIQKDGKNVFPDNQFDVKTTPLIEVSAQEGKANAIIFEPVTYALTWSDGQQEVVNAKQASPEIQLSGKWDLSVPFRFDITPFVKAGNNNLEVEVVNLWVNRLIGDGKLPESQRLTKVSVNITKFNNFDAEKYLRESGLLGAVKIRITDQQDLK